MVKRYEYKGEIYCEEDLSEEIENYGGDLFDLYWNLKTAGDAIEWKYYASIQNPENTYDSVEDLIEKEFDYLEVDHG